MHSARFDLDIVLTEHAKLRMAERDIAPTLIVDIVDTGMHRWGPKP